MQGLKTQGGYEGVGCRRGGELKFRNVGIDGCS